MLQLLIGPSGSGKTHHILRRMQEMTQAGQENILWLVPEQHSFESERLLLKELGPQQAAQVQVLSFSRLADRVFRQVGGISGDWLDEGTRALLMSRALEQAAAVAEDTGNPMTVLRPHLTNDSAYVEQLITLWQELKQCAVTTDQLEQVSLELAEEEGLLPGKTADLYRVFATYEGLVQSVGLDELDRLTRLAEGLPRCDLPQDAAVFVDGFKGFTNQELAVLEGFLPRCREMTVALCTDTPGVRWPGTSPTDCRREYTLFSPVTDTVEQLRRLAAKHNQKWELTRLTENHRTADLALQALANGLYAPVPQVYEDAAPMVMVTPCPDVYEECRYTVRAIRRLMREEGYRCGEIAVVARNLADYQGLLDEMLARDGIPCYMDARQEILCEPLVVYIRAALRLAVDGWRTEELLRLMKTDLWVLDPVEIAEMENYVYTWRIEGKRWEQEWTENPAGLDAPFTAADRALLARLNARRAALMDSLSTLRKSLRGGATGRQFAMAVYRWLTTQDDLPGRIAAQMAVLEEMAQPVLAAHAARLWDEVMNILDRFVLAVGEMRLPASRLESLFTMLCRMIDLGTIPQGLDAVTVGSADRIRYNHPRAVFVLGANEGVFPAYPAGDGLLTEDERQQLKDKGLSLAEDLLTQCVEERYYVYTAVAAPSQRLYVSYRTDGDTAESPLVTAIGRILPGHTVGTYRCADGSDLESADEMFRRLAEQYATATPLAQTLVQTIAGQPAYAQRLQAVERAAKGGAYRLEDKQTARDLFGSDMCLSASQATQFYQCRFQYFCNYGLRIRPRRVAEVDYGIFGTLVHYAMEVLLPTYTQPEGLVEELRRQEMTPMVDRELMLRLQTDVHRVLNEYIDRNMGGVAEKDGRFLYQVNLAERSACNMLWHTLMELQQGQFNPVDYELSIHPEEETDTDGVLSLRLPITGGSVQVRGKVDRVDLFVRFDGTAYVRVVDYKTGSTKFELCELTAGLGMQMLLYLFILCDNSRRYLEQEGVLRPAGVLYHPLSDLVISRGNDATDRLKQMRMNGLVLDDASVVLAMEKETSGNFIPAKLNKEGKPTGSVVTLQQFNLLRGVVEDLLVQMGESLLDGDIAALPLKRGESLPCQYCDYRAVCGRDPEDPVKELEKKGLSAVLEDLEEGQVTPHG